MNDSDRLRALVRQSPLLMDALRAVRAVDPPDWLRERRCDP